ncbi:MAG: elongation factor P maturation arginine rhamnosyltransferase EarP [Treponema sp.]|uniref:elongation factor P maturation arginine rhamnosyltransferase EarP n=1 Tax=Treponema sp. TaxID=166 RepID=UPI0025FA5075|nr:elongation factor P maturation arginine rhamnosyltransferase EarP [Treponema sp.]MBQ8678938.1 elongation factor P maturation arginine rhamnosyltransferase EarP [Treponema sp.]
MLDKNNILILCKVVDNFGDIGVVYRLARALSDLRPDLNLTLVVSNLESFHKMASQIDPQKKIQDFRYRNSTWKILDWHLDNAECRMLNAECAFNFSIILECFQCGRPDWLESLLFSEDFDRPVQILQIDYLTAEDYAEEFHLLKSGTRKTNIKKRFFMPGFTEKTGGLIINDVCKMQNSKAETTTCDIFKIFFFAYEDDCAAVVKGISDFQSRMRESKPDFSVLVYLAEGKSSAPFEEAWKDFNSPFEIEKIPFLQQEEFDSFILTMDFLFVRGEDSLARACLSALPFVWQAYKQDENYQLVKVNALLDQMKNYFSKEEFQAIQDFWQSYNDYEKESQAAPLTELLLSSATGKNKGGFQNFAKKLHENGNLAAHLLEFIDSL